MASYRVNATSAPVWSTSLGGSKRGDYKKYDVLEIGNQEFGRGNVLDVIDPISREYIKGWVAMLHLSLVTVDPPPPPPPDPIPLPDEYFWHVKDGITRKFVLANE